MWDCIMWFLYSLATNVWTCKRFILLLLWLLVVRGYQPGCRGNGQAVDLLASSAVRCYHDGRNSLLDFRTGVFLLTGESRPLSVVPHRVIDVCETSEKPEGFRFNSFSNSKSKLFCHIWNIQLFNIFENLWGISDKYLKHWKTLKTGNCHNFGIFLNKFEIIMKIKTTIQFKI